MGKVKLLPELRFPGFEGEWGKIILNNIGSYLGGGTPDSTKKKFWNGHIPWISSSDINEDNIQDINVTRYITQEAINMSATKLIPKNSLLIVSRVGVGKFSVAKFDLCTSQDFTNISINQDKYNSYFFAYYFSAKKNRFIRLSQGTSIKGFTSEDIRCISFVIPNTISEQTRIATFLTSVDRRISLLTQKKEKLVCYKQGVMQKIFSQELRFKDEDGKDFPEWEEKRLGEIGVFFSGGTPLTTKRQYFNGNIPFIRSGEINADSTEQYITEDGLKNSSAKMVEVGDLIYALYGATSGEVAISKIKGAINQAILCIRTDLNNAFLLNYLILNKENILKTYLQGGQGNLSAEIIKSLQIPVPSFPEQTRIASFLTALDQQIEKVDAQIGEMKGWKKGLLQKMFV